MWFSFVLCVCFVYLFRGEPRSGSMAASGSRRVVLDGCSLTCRALTQLGAPGSKIAICSDSMHRIKEARKVVDKLVERGFDEGHVAYGINTGFGLFADVIIGNDELATLQRNLIRSHSAGVGTPLSPAETRRLLALRLNVLAKGHSGIRAETVEKMVAAFNADCLSVVPAQGTVGASGDLAPLSVRHSFGSVPCCSRKLMVSGVMAALLEFESP